MEINNYQSFNFQVSIMQTNCPHMFQNHGKFKKQFKSVSDMNNWSVNVIVGHKVLAKKLNFSSELKGLPNQIGYCIFVETQSC